MSFHRVIWRMKAKFHGRNHWCGFNCVVVTRFRPFVGVVAHAISIYLHPTCFIETGVKTTRWPCRSSFNRRFNQPYLSRLDVDNNIPNWRNLRLFLVMNQTHSLSHSSQPRLWKRLQRVTCVLWMWWCFIFEWLNVTFQIRGGVASQGSEESPCCCEAHVPLIPCNEPNTRLSGHRAPLESQKLCCLTQEAAVCVHVCLLRYHTPVDKWRCYVLLSYP